MRTIKAILILAITLLMNSNLLAQEVRVSNFQKIEASNVEPWFEDGMRYFFILSEDGVQVTNKKGTENLGTYSYGEMYTKGDISFMWSFTSEDMIVIKQKDAFTGQWKKISYLLKKSRKK